MINVHITSGIRYGLDEYTDSLLVVVPATSTEPEARWRYPFSGGCWAWVPSNARDMRTGRELYEWHQTEGTCDIRAPRSPARWRAFVRREHVG